MNELRLELSIPGKSLSKNAAREQDIPDAPDLVLDLRCRKEAVSDFCAFLGKNENSFRLESFRCAVKDDTAEFCFSEAFLSKKITEIASLEGAARLYPSSCAAKKTVIKKSEKKDFYIFYALMRASFEKQGKDAECGGDGFCNLFSKCRPARILAALLLSGLSQLCEETPENYKKIVFTIKNGNFARLAAELYYLTEKYCDGNVPARLAACTEAYIRGMTEESDEA